MPDVDNNSAAAATPESKSKKKKKNKKKGGQGGHTQNDTKASDTLQRPLSESVGVVDKEDESEDSEPEVGENDAIQQRDLSAGPPVADVTATSKTNGTAKAETETSETVPQDPTARFDALVKDRDALRAEVTQLRSSLEQLQAKHNIEVKDVKKELEESQTEKEHAEEQYQNLLGKVNTIRSQLGQRLKEDAEELAQARTRIEELEEQKSGLQEQYTTRSGEVEELTSKLKEQEKELSGLRSRSSLSQQNWIKEKEELIESESYIREEFENAKQAMHDWEVLAMEERQKRRDLTEALADIEEQLANLKSEHESTVNERNHQSSTVDGLQKAMQEIQEARRKELRDIVETSQSELSTLRKQLEDLQTESEKVTKELGEAKSELERALPFEKEVKEKNLLIGKLRHEAVILNDHLTKALRFLKKGKPEDNVDRQIVTNHFLHFLALDRSDPKKFQVLQLIAALLNWTDEQKEQAGLTRPGGAGQISLVGSLRLPSSPLVHRTPSTPSLMSADYFATESLRSPEQKESLAELWQNFLEQEAGQKSRVPSIASPRGSTADGLNEPSTPKA